MINWPSLSYPSDNYCIHSKNLSPTVARKNCHLVAIRIGMNSVAEGDEYLDYLDETLERAVKPWSVLLGGGGGAWEGN